MSIFPRISFCDDPPEIDISRSGKPPRPRPCPPQWPRASPPGAAAAAPQAPAAQQMPRRRANKARLAAARQAGRVSSGRAPFATCVPSKWMGCSTRISGAMAICGTRHGRSTKAQSRTRSSVRCTGPGTPISHTDDGQVVQDIGKRRDRLDAHAWASSQLVELVFDESDIADASSDKKHPPQGWTNSDPQGRQRLYSKAYWVHMLSAITSFAWSNREQPKGAEIKPWLDYAWSMSVSAAFCSHMSAVYHPSLGLGVWGYGVGWCPPRVGRGMGVASFQTAIYTPHDLWLCMM